MQFFREKPLSLMIFVMLGGFSLFSIKALALSIVFTVLLFAFLLINVIYKKKKGENFKFHILLLALMLLSTTLSYLYFNIFRTIPEKEAVIEAEILAQSHSDNQACYEVKCTRIDGKARNVDLILYADSDFDNFKTGDIIVTTVSLRNFDRTDPYDSYQYSRGFIGEAKHVTTNITRVGHNKHVLRDFLLTINLGFAEFITSIFDEEAGGLFLALLIGNKSFLSNAYRLDFTRIGISHILALSGQHLAILSLLIHRLLSLCRLNKKWRLSLLCVFVVFYMTLTGFSPSITRAGLMLIFSSVAFLLGNSYDASTGLFTSVFLFVLFQPYCITDTSLLLSAFATFGVLRALDYTEKAKTKRAKLLAPILASIIISLFAMLYTSFLSVFKFSYISIFSPITSLIFSFLVEIFIYLGLLLCVLGTFLPVRAIASFLCKCIVTPANFLSSFEFAYFSSEFTLCTVFAVLLICALLYYLLYPVKRKKFALIGISSLCLCIYLVAIVGTSATLFKDELLYFQEEEKLEECVLMKENGNVAFVDILPSRYKGTAETLKTIKGEHLPHIDDYILMGYDSNTSEHLNRIFYDIKVHSLYLSEPKTDDDFLNFESIVSLAQTYGIPYSTFDKEQYLALDGTKVYITQTHGTQERHLPIFALEYKNERFMYLSLGALDQYSFAPVFKLYDGCQGLIFGSRGIQSNYFFNIQDLPASVSTIVISNDKNYLTPEFSEQFMKYGKLYSYPKRLKLK